MKSTSYLLKYKIGNISTSQKEIVDITKAWIAISVAFAILLTGGPIYNNIFSSKFYSMFIISSITVGIGFLLHELGHKFVAQRYGCFAEFRSFDNMLVLAILMSFFGFLIAAPGAVFISGKVGRERNGKISAAGPVVNIILAVVFLAASFSSIEIIKKTSFYGFMINSWLALFNMIPLWNFDGAKIFKWNKLYYFAITATAFIFVFARNFV